MIPEEIKKLLDSMDPADNAVGWELVDAKEVSFKDVRDYVSITMVPTNYIKKYRWDAYQHKFVRQDLGTDEKLSMAKSIAQISMYQKQAQIARNNRIKKTI